MKLLLSLMLLLLLQSCFKTTEQIKREKQIDIQLKQSTKLVSDLTLQVQDLQSKVSNTTGQIEEIDHQSKSSINKTQTEMRENINKLNQQVDTLIEQNSSQEQKINGVVTKLQSQQKYIKKLLATLNSSGPSLSDAHKAFEKGQNKKASVLYEEVLVIGKINAAQKNHVYYNLGLLKYRSKKYDDSIALFSKIYTKYPKSSWSRYALLQIARSFDKKGMPQEAKATYNEVIKKYPNTKQAQAAKKEIK